jgi:hypothetical protein
MRSESHRDFERKHTTTVGKDMKERDTKRNSQYMLLMHSQDKNTSAADKEE